MSEPIIDLVYLTKETLPPLCDACGQLMVRRDWTREANGPCVFWACDQCKTHIGLYEAIATLRSQP